jgi:hypothetical protein
MHLRGASSESWLLKTIRPARETPAGLIKNFVLYKNFVGEEKREFLSVASLISCSNPSSLN